MSIIKDPLILDIKHKLCNEIDRLSLFIADGKATSIEDYRKQTGKLAGIKLSLEVIDECAKSYIHDDESD